MSLVALQHAEFASNADKPLLQGIKRQLICAAIDSSRRQDQDDCRSVSIRKDTDHDSQPEQDEITSTAETSENGGLVLLFHGGPGTGKTATAYFVAEYIHRPLLRLTHAKLSYDISKLPARPVEWACELAQGWGSVVLLEDADVYLKARDKGSGNPNLVTSESSHTLQRGRGADNVNFI